MSSVHAMFDRRTERRYRVRSAKAEVRTRYVVNFRIDPDFARRLVPVDWLEPQLVNGFAVLSFCPYVLDAVRFSAVPRIFGVQAICSAYRLAVVDRSGTEQRPAAWVPARETNARSIAVLGPGSLRTRFDRVTASISEQAGTTSLAVTHADGATHMRATLRPSPRPGGMLFDDTESFSEFFTAADTSWAPGPTANSLMQLDLDAGETHYFPLSVETIEAPGAGDGAVVDSAFVGIGGSYCWSCAGVRDLPADPTVR